MHGVFGSSAIDSGHNVFAGCYWAERRLTDAEPAQLEAWGERVLEAATLEVVLADG